MFFIAKAQKDYTLISGQIKTTKICFLLLHETKKQTSLRQRRVCCCCYCCGCCFCCCCCCRFDSWDNQRVKKTQSGISFVFKRGQRLGKKWRKQVASWLIGRSQPALISFVASSIVTQSLLVSRNNFSTLVQEWSRPQVLTNDMFILTGNATYSVDLSMLGGGLRH